MGVRIEIHLCHYPFFFYDCYSLKSLHIPTAHDYIIYNPLHETIGRENNDISWFS